MSHMEQTKQMDLMPHQMEGIRFIGDHIYSYIAWDMGLGKTALVLCAIKDMGLSCALIIVPAYLKENWRAEAIKWGWKDCDIQVIHGRKDKLEWKRLTIVSYDAPTIRNVLSQSMGFSIVVCDEAHYLRGKKSQRSKVILGTDKRIKAPVCKNTERMVFLSGTPLLHRPIELWPILQMVFPEGFGDYYQYAHHFCAAYQGAFGLDVSGASNLDELKNVLAHFMHRLKKDDVLELPGKGQSVITLEKSKAVEELLFKEQQLNIDLERVMDEGVAIGEYATIRRELGLLKIDYAKEFVQSFVDQGEPVVVFTYHKDVAKALSENPITGEMPTQKRQEIVDHFQNNGGIIVGTYGAMGTGFTLTKASNVVFVELDYSPMIMEQAEDRLNRIGQTKKVTSHVLLWDKGLEKRLWKALGKKKHTFTTLIEE